MTEKEIIKRLKAVAKEDVKIEKDKRDANIELLMNKAISEKRRSGTFEFIISQIRFTNKIDLLWQGVWILLFLYSFWNGKVLHIDNEDLCILSMAPPLLLFLTIEDLTRIYNKSVLEIEYATKYSLRKVVLVRMLILSSINGLLIFIGIIFAKHKMSLPLLETLVYSLTPLLLMNCFLLKIMEKWKGEQLKYAGVALYFFTLLAILMGSRKDIGIYLPDVFGVWLLVFAVGIVATVYQMNRLMKHLKNFELLMD